MTILITKDTKNPENIFKVDDKHDEEKDTIRKKNIVGGNTATERQDGWERYWTCQRWVE